MKLLSNLIFAFLSSQPILAFASSTCPDLNGTFVATTPGPLTNKNMQKIENGTTMFSWSGGSGKSHRNKNTTYTASCVDGTWLNLEMIADGFPEEEMGFEKTSEGYNLNFGNNPPLTFIFKKTAP